MAKDTPEIIPVQAGSNEAKVLIAQYIDSITKLLEEQENIKATIKEAYDEAKHNGLDVKHLRHVVKLAMMDSDDARQQAAEDETVRRLYTTTAGFPVGE